MKQQLVLNLFVGFNLRDFSFNFDLSTERTVSKNKIHTDYSIQQRSRIHKTHEKTTSRSTLLE